MDSSDSKPPQDRDSSQSVRVAVNIRPLITPELANGCTDCITVVPGEPQVQIGSHTFTYDYVYGRKGSPSSKIFDDCAAPLVDALFNGYNATVLAYGQTGSGKTYTMGTNYHGDDNCSGVIPRVIDTIFKRVERMKSSSEFLIRVSFIEIFKEEVFDLLDSNSSLCKGDGLPSSRAGGGGVRAPIQIRETVNGGITLAGVTEAEVKNKDEMASFLLKGSVARATGSTNMNSQSSRSHAIFTISVEQKKGAEVGDDILSSKLHLVDLAGSERAKRTGADGMRLKEGIHINKGLLALGNVISALGDERKRKEGAHVPYRDSKLTRLLQDSLGGNSKTVMIACVSPADTNAEETLNTLKYANRARNIQNKAIINRDPVADQLQKMRCQIEQLQSELLFYKGDMRVPYEELQILKHKVSLLEASNAELQRELKERQISCEQLMQRAIDAQVEKDKLIMQIESVRNGKSWDEIDENVEKDCDLLKSYVSKIQELEEELLRLQNLNKRKQQVLDWTDSDDDGLNGKTGPVSCLDDLAFSSGLKGLDLADDAGVKEKEQEHSSLQEKLDKELKELDQKLEEKEAEMKRVGTSECSVLRQHYEKKLLEMDQQKRTLQREIDELRSNLSNISSASDDGAQKLKEEYLQKLNLLESQVAELKKKQEAQSQLLRQKQKSDEAAKRLQDEIHRIKSQKVQLQHKIKQESESFRLWKAAREKEVLQLKKEGRRNEYEMHKLLALNQRQKMVLQRKTEEASMATKRLKELLESRKIASRENGSSLSVQALMQAIEHELEVTVRVHEVRSEYERQMEEREKMAKEITRLKEEVNMQKQMIMINHPQGMSPGARNSRIFALENMLGTSSSTLVSMASQLSEAEERERSFSGRGRWNQVRSIAEAKSLMNYLFNIASSSRCQLRDKEVDCREKDSEIRDLKQKIVQLNSALRQSEKQKAELVQQNMLLKHTREIGNDSAFDTMSGPRKYPLRKQENRNSIYVFEDMDIAESESDSEVMDDDDDDEWVQSVKPSRKRVSRTVTRSSLAPRQFESIEKTCAKEAHGDGTVSGAEDSGRCCSCSKSSRCKTNKCECRQAGGSCGGNCGCLASLCSNRESDSSKDEASDVEIQSSALATQGLALLQSAFGDAMPSGENDDGGSKRKPLSDIGNKSKPNVPKPNQRKKWGGKQVLQLVPQTPTAAQPETPAPAVTKPEEATIQGGDLPLRLPRAMRTPAASGSTNPLRERNSDASSDSSSIISKDTGSQDPKTRAAIPGDKENAAL